MPIELFIAMNYLASDERFKVHLVIPSFMLIFSEIIYQNIKKFNIQTILLLARWVK